jgi:hypothetical protein
MHQCKAKLSLYLIEPNILQTYGGVEVPCLTFLIFALDGGDCSLQVVVLVPRRNGVRYWLIRMLGSFKNVLDARTPSGQQLWGARNSDYPSVE